MKNGVPFIDEDLNINLHGLEGGLGTFVFEDDAGNPRDMTGATVTFEVQGFSKALTAGGQNNEMILTLVPEDLDQFLNQTQPYVILDSSGSVPHVVVEGNVRVYGWT